MLCRREPGAISGRKYGRNVWQWPVNSALRWGSDAANVGQMWAVNTARVKESGVTGRVACFGAERPKDGLIGRRQWPG